MVFKMLTITLINNLFKILLEDMIKIMMEKLTMISL
jgi:hypothetical protein